MVGKATVERQVREFSAPLLARARGPRCSRRAFDGLLTSPPMGSPAAPPKPRARGLSRHLEGWQPGFVAVAVAGAAAVLAVPRSVPPHELPVPAPMPAALAEVRASDQRRAALAAAEPLPLEVRAVGSAIRAYGIADAAEDEAAAVRAKDEAVRAAVAPQVDGEGLLRLRAFQLEVFLREVRRFELTGQPSDELAAVGGAFPRMVQDNGWCEGDPCQRVRLDDAALRASFKKRWNEITGSRNPALALTLDEQRALALFLLRHPVPVRGGGQALDAASREAQVTQFLLRKVDDLGALDGAYPRDFARGVVLYRMGRFPLAVEAFRAHLDAHPDGPLALRAQNHLRAALEEAQESGMPEGHGHAH
jgi:hypothetical protein